MEQKSGFNPPRESPDVEKASPKSPVKCLLDPSVFEFNSFLYNFSKSKSMGKNRNQQKLKNIHITSQPSVELLKGEERPPKHMETNQGINEEVFTKNKPL